MNKFYLLITLLSSLLLSPQILAASDCTANCVSFAHIGNKLAITQFDANGKAVDIKTVNVINKSQLIKSFKEEVIHDANVKTVTKTFHAKTKIVVIHTNLYLDKNGELIDVSVNVNTFPKKSNEGMLK